MSQSREQDVLGGFETKVRGVKFANAESGLKRQCMLEGEGLKVGDLLVLKPVQENVHDSNAVGVFTQSGIQLGWIPQRDGSSARVTKKIDSRRWKYGAFVSEKRERSEDHPLIGFSVFVFFVEPDLSDEEIQRRFRERYRTSKLGT